MYERQTEAEKQKQKKEQEEGEPPIQIEEAMGKAVVGLLKTPDPDLMSEVTPDQHRAMTALAMRASKYDINCLQTYLEAWLKLMVSHKRLGRKEIFGIAKAIQQEEGKQSRLERLKGVLGIGEDY